MAELHENIGEAEAGEQEVDVQPVLEVCFERDGLWPESVPLSTLARALTAIHRLASGPIDEADQCDAEDAEPASVSDEDIGPFQLLSVRRGSAVYRLSGQAPDRAIENLRMTGEVVTSPDRTELGAGMLRPLRELSSVAGRLGCEIVVRRPGGVGGDLARVRPQSYAEVTNSAFIEGETEIAGTVKGVGGVGTLRCKLRVEFQRRLLYCHIRDSRTARKLGAALYQDVVIKGTAKWLKSSWRIYDFEIHGVSQPRAGNLLEAMDELRAAGGSGWDDVADPMAFLEELRGGG